MPSTSGIQAPGIGSGLDVNGIVEKLMQVERRTLSNLQAKEKDYKAELSAYGKLKNAADSFSSTAAGMSDVNQLKVAGVQVDNSSILTGSATQDSSFGSYQISVSQLAKQNKVASAQFSDSTTALNLTGDLEISVGGADFAFSVLATDALSDIKNSINNSPENSIVQASIMNVNDELGNPVSLLVLTAIDGGQNNTISVADQTGQVAETLSVVNVLSPGQDAILKIDGLTVQQSSNTIENAIEGVTLNLSQTGDAGNVTVTENLGSVTSAITGFMNGYNDFLDCINGLYQNNLKHDNSLLRIKNELRSILFTPSTGEGQYQMLSDVGITFDQVTGNLQLDEESLGNALKDNFNAVINLFNNTNDGYAKRMADFAQSLTVTDGLVDVHNTSVNQMMSRMDDRIAQEERHLEKVEKNYVRQFAALDVFVARMNANNEYLTQQFNQFSKQTN